MDRKIPGNEDCVYRNTHAHARTHKTPPAAGAIRTAAALHGTRHPRDVYKRRLPFAGGDAGRRVEKENTSELQAIFWHITCLAP